MKKFTKEVYITKSYVEDLVIEKADNNFILYMFKNVFPVLDDEGNPQQNIFKADTIKGEFEASNYEDACQNAIACVYSYSDEFKLINDKIAGIESDEYTEYRTIVESIKTKIKSFYEEEA